MSPQKTTIPLINKTYNITLKLIRQGNVLLPFIIFAFVEALALTTLFLAPRSPFNIVLAPPIRAFWGERFLHYPANFLLLPKLVSLSRMALSVILSSLLTGMAVSIVFNSYTKKHAKLKDSFLAALKKYASLFIIVLIFVLLYYFLIKLITTGLWVYFVKGHESFLFLKPGAWFTIILPCLNFILAVLIQSVFIYAIPILIIDKENLIKSIVKSFNICRRFFVRTVILVGLPLLIYIPIIVLDYNTAFLINKLFPEFVLIVLFVGIIVSSLIIDPVITVSTTVFYLLLKEEK